MTDRIVIAAVCLLTVAFAACGSFFSPASRGVQTLPPDAIACYRASGIRVYATEDPCPIRSRVAAAVDSAALLPADKDDLRILVTSEAIACAGKFAVSCSDGWTVTVSKGAIGTALPYELRNLLAARVLGHTPPPAPAIDYEHLPGWSVSVPAVGVSQQ